MIFSSVHFSHSVMSDSLPPRGLQHVRPPCPSPTLRACSNPCPLSIWCHPTVSSSVVLFLLPSILPSVRVFPSDSVLQIRWPVYWSFSFSTSLSMNIQDLSPSEWTGWISLQSNGLSRVFSNTTVQKHEFFSVQPSLWSNAHIHTWLLEKNIA